MVTLALVAVGSPAQAADIAVPGTYATIPLAVAAAADGDVILVGDGTYSGDIAVNKRVTLRAVNPGGAILTGTVTLTAVSTVTGFTITPTSPTANGVSITGAGAGSTVIGNTISGTRELIAVRAATGTSSAPTIIQDNVLRNVVGSTPSAVWVSASSYVNITGNTITNVGPPPAGSVGVNVSQGASFVSITGNTIDQFENAVAVIALTTPITGVEITANDISNTSFSAIVFGNANIAAATVSGNALTNIAPGTTGRGAIQIGVAALPAPTGSPALEDFLIVDNDIDTATNGVVVNDGVRLVDATSFVVADNTFRSLSGNAIQVGTAVATSIAASGNDFGGAAVVGNVVVAAAPVAPAPIVASPAAVPTLPDTGVTTAPILGLSALLLLLGAALTATAAARRRRTAA